MGEKETDLNKDFEFESFENEQYEKYFKCPYCHSKISMVLDISEPGRQFYVEDCEVCCKPIQISYSSDQGKLVDFFAQTI